jgi:hypothetical protein
VHLGHGTLREIADMEASGNRYSEWAAWHRDPHFGGQAEAEQPYNAFVSQFDREVGQLTAEQLIAACREPSLLQL